MSHLTDLKNKKIAFKIVLRDECNSASNSNLKQEFVRVNPVLFERSLVVERLSRSLARTCGIHTDLTAILLPKQGQGLFPSPSLFGSRP